MSIEHEHIQQAALFQWAATMEVAYPELALMYAVPNGGKRPPRTAGKMKAEGQKRGVPDICLPVARGPYHGYYIEMKAEYPNGGRGRVSDEQQTWIFALRRQGYRVDAFWDWEKAREALLDYLEEGTAEDG